jgi:hypothetical protein
LYTYGRKGKTMAEEVPKLLMYIPKIILKERKSNEQWVLRKVQYKNRKFVIALSKKENF